MKRKLKWLAIVLVVSLLGFGMALLLWPRDRITVEWWNWADLLGNSKRRFGRIRKTRSWIWTGSKYGLDDADASQLNWTKTTTFAGNTSREADGSMRVSSSVSLQTLRSTAGIFLQLAHALLVEFPADEESQRWGDAIDPPEDFPPGGHDNNRPILPDRGENLGSEPLRSHGSETFPIPALGFWRDRQQGLAVFSSFQDRRADHAGAENADANSGCGCLGAQRKG